jgi:hypothetical protein
MFGLIAPCEVERCWQAIYAVTNNAAKQIVFFMPLIRP